MAAPRKVVDLAELQPNEEPVQITVKKVTDEYEYIEVNGMTIKRRKTVAQAAPPRPPMLDLQELKTPHTSAVGRTSIASQRTPNVEEYEITPELYERLSRSLHELPETATPSQHLLATCKAIWEAEVDIANKKGETQLVEALNAVYNEFMQAVESAIQKGDIQFAPSDGLGPRLDNEDLRVDLQARKAGLRNRLHMLEHEEKEWHTLLSKVESLNIQPPTHDDDTNTNNDTLNTAIDSLAGEEIAALQALQHDVHRQLTLQVDAMCMLVGNMEDLIEKAHGTMQEAQVKLHEEKLKAFPHVYSPARLIRAIVRPTTDGNSGGGGGGGGDMNEGGEET